MPTPLLLSRIRLCFDKLDDDLVGALSAVTVTPDGSLWIGADELLSVERLSRLEPGIFGQHRTFAIGDFIPLFNQKDEIDIEGMDYAEPYLWLTGSHSTKRKKAKGDDSITDLETIATDDNRYLVARLPVLNGGLMSSVAPDPDQPPLTAACLQKTNYGNTLIEALRTDLHLGPFLNFPLPSKENGFDIEGLAVCQERLFLGLRGPVLRGWAMILEIAVAETSPGVLTLQNIGPDARAYKKHFVDLNGMGIRDLCVQGDDLLILAGPTMALEGAMRVFRRRDAFQTEGDSIARQESGEIEVVFDLPFTFGSDHAEGLALVPCLGYPEALLIVYDDPDPARRPEAHVVFADIFRL
jgi:hypothetical protein